MTDEKMITEEGEAESQEKAQASKRQEELNDVAFLLGTVQGMRFLCRIMDAGHVFKTSFTNNGYTAFYEGERSMALRILDDVSEVGNADKIKDLLVRSIDIKGGK